MKRHHNGNGAHKLKQSQTNPPPLMHNGEEKRISNKNDLRTTTFDSTIEQMPEKHSATSEIWTSFINRPYKKITIPQKTLYGRAVRKLIAHSL